MRSKARIIKGHPIHPMLVPFPLAALFGAFFFDLAGVAAQRPMWWITGGTLTVLGIVTAVAAAIPGLIDYVYVVPPDSTGRGRATRHMIANLSAVTLFAVAWVLRGGTSAEPTLLLLIMEGAGVLLLGAGGYMGGTLVFRNQIGVDHRYAGAGKWRESDIALERGSAVVARTGELEVNQMKLLRVSGRRIVLARTEDGYVAFDDHCTHRGGPLADGVMICGTVQCPWHGSQFDVKTGKVKAGPAQQGIGTYRVEEKDSEVRLVL